MDTRILLGHYHQKGKKDKDVSEINIGKTF